MTQTTQEKQNQTHTMLIGAVAVLAVALIAMTGFLIKTNEKVSRLTEQLQPARTAVAVSQWQPPAAADPAQDPFLWDPFSEMERMQTRMNRMFRDSFRRANMLFDNPRGGLVAFFEPEVDIQDKGGHYIVTMDIPGMEKNKINIEVTEHALTVSGERRSETKEEDEEQGYYRMERQLGSFLRTIPLPADADSEVVTANYQNGVLTIRLSKQPAKQPQEQEETKKIAIQ